MFYLKQKNIPITLICFFACSLQSSAHNIDYNTSILGWRDIVEQNSSYNIEKGRLLKGYLESLRKEIVDIKKDNYIQNERLEDISSELNKMELALNNTLTVHYEKHHAIWVYESIIEKIKTIKNELSNILKTELQSSADRLEKNKLEKNKKAEIVSKKINSFVTLFTPKVRQLENTQKKQLILSSITVINQESSKLSFFSTKEFSSIRQMDEYYSNSLRTIKREFHKIQLIILNN
jgi:hypothetical protein